MVGEFPELQGYMGRAYALKQGEAPEVADAIRDHYKPTGAQDDIAPGDVSAAVALALGGSLRHAGRLLRRGPRADRRRRPPSPSVALASARCAR